MRNLPRRARLHRAPPRPGPPRGVGNTVYAIERGIKCINWLTLLSLDLVTKLGGEDHLRATLGPGIKVHLLPFGVAVQAGPEPRLGDVNRKERLSDYERVGHVLAKVRASNHPGFLGPDDTKKEDTEKWLSRFD